MLIQLKQSEIEVALHNYISQQGINLVGKSVSIEFTAGRKEAGITADISIESSALCGQAVSNPQAASQKMAEAVEGVPERAPEPDPAEAVNEDSAAVPVAKSLFAA